MRFVGQGHALAPIHPVLVDINFAGDLRQGIIQQSCEVGARQSTKLRNQTAGSARIGTTRQHGLDVHRNHVAFFRALNHDRAVLRIEKRDTQFGAGQILLGDNFSLKGVPGIDDHPITWLDHHHRLRIRADGVVEYSLALLA